MYCGYDVCFLLYCVYLVLFFFFFSYFCFCFVLCFYIYVFFFFFFFQAEDGIRDRTVTGVQTCALPICITDQRGLDVSLRPEDRGPSLADGDAPRILAAERQDIQRDKSIVVDDIGLAQALCRPQRQKPGVARTRSHEADDASERRPGYAPGRAPFRCPRSSRDRAAQDLFEKREPRGCLLLVARLACERGEACQQPPPEAVRSLLIPGGQLEQLQESSEAQE